MDVTIQVLSDGNLIAVKTFGSPLTAAEAKAGLQDECSTWVGTLTGENTSTVLVGERQLSAGSTYNLKLRQQSGNFLHLLFYWLLLNTRFRPGPGSQSKVLQLSLHSLLSECCTKGRLLEGALTQGVCVCGS